LVADGLAGRDANRSGRPALDLQVREQAVLLAVLRLRDEAYRRAILREVPPRLERDVAAGAVHAALDHLEHKGCVSCSAFLAHLRNGSY
jgi:hypothetical protein